MPNKPVSELNPKTIKNYENSLKKINMSDFTKVNEVRDRIVSLVGNKDKNGNIRSDSQKANNIGRYLTSVIYHLRVEEEAIIDDEEKSENLELQEKYREILKKCCQVYTKGREKNERNAREEENWIEWDEVISLRDKFEKEFDSLKRYKKRASKKLLVMGLYTFLPPRRLEDYVLMKYYEERPKKLKGIVDESKDKVLEEILQGDYDIDENGDIIFSEEEKQVEKEEETEEEIEEKPKPNFSNYYIKSEKKFIFCKYKTSDTYGITEVHVPKNLRRYIKIYLKYNKIESGDLLLNYGDIRGLAQTISDQFNNANVTRLRQSYISWFQNNNPDATIEDKREQARLMAHDVSTQGEYRKIGKKIKEEKVE